MIYYSFHKWSTRRRQISGWTFQVLFLLFKFIKEDVFITCMIYTLSNKMNPTRGCVRTLILKWTWTFFEGSFPFLFFWFLWNTMIFVSRNETTAVQTWNWLIGNTGNWCKFQPYTVAKEIRTLTDDILVTGKKASN